MSKMSCLASVSATRAVLESHGLATKHSLGQNFLINDDVLRKIIDLAEAGPADNILEVGPGIGTLTIALLQHAKRVLSIERDADLLPVLAETTAPWADRFSLVNMDALALAGCLENTNKDSLSAEARSFFSQDFSQDAATSIKLVSNLPYAVAATVVLDYFQRIKGMASATVMVQREVADRMMARVGTKDYGAYTVKLSLFARPAGRFAVGAGNFFPPPRVESAVIRLDRWHPTDAQGVKLCDDAIRATCRMADAAFANRRKTILNSCKTFFASDENMSHDVLVELFNRTGIDARRRGETLSIEEFIALGVQYCEVCGSSGIK